jgi:pteridine reductase
LTSERNKLPLSGRVALVTGGVQRVGRAIVLELARAGCSVAVHHRRSAETADEVAAQIADLGRRATTVAGDLNEPSTWPAIIDQTVVELGKLNILVNNASAFLTEGSDTIEGFDAELWDLMLRTNLIAPAALCHHAREHLRADGSGKIVNLCDVAAERPWPGSLAYCASKAGLVSLTKALARALAPGIQVFGVSPGIAVFPDCYPPAKRERLVARVPQKRAGTPEEVARLVRFLVEHGEYMTGQILTIDGGRSLV